MDGRRETGTDDGRGKETCENPANRDASDAFAARLLMVFVSVFHKKDRKKKKKKGKLETNPKLF